MSLIFSVRSVPNAVAICQASMKFVIAVAGLLAVAFLQITTAAKPLKPRIATRPILTIKEKFSKAELQELSASEKMDSSIFGAKGNVAISTHIIGGVVASRGQYPWQAALTMDNDFFCGGSLITTRHILTAAHCADGVSVFSVLLGAQNKDEAEDGRIAMDTTSKVVHNRWDSDVVKNDIAILILPSAVTTNSYIKTIRLPRRSAVRSSFVGLSATVSGWGRTSDSNENVSTVLYDVRVRVTSPYECVHLYGKSSFTKLNLCISGKNTKGTCNGDSGGPLVVKELDGGWTQVGIVSFGAAAGCAKGYPDVFTRVASFLPWISKQSNVPLRS